MAQMERVLWVELVPKERVGATLSGEGASQLSLGGFSEQFLREDGWEIVSHTFEIREGDSAVLTLLFEREIEDS